MLHMTRALASIEICTSLNKGALEPTRVKGC
jgi:hypothetical protein